MRTTRKLEAPSTILLVGADPLLCERTRAVLSGSPFHLVAAAANEAAGADLVIMPAVDFVGFAARGFAALGAPVIAYGPAALMRGAFLLGCVDYLRDPWTPDELLLRAEAARLRGETAAELPWAGARLHGGLLCTPLGTTQLTWHQAVILRALLRRRGHPVSRAALAGLLGPRCGGAGRRVDVHVSGMRRRVRSVLPAGSGPLVVCVRGQGYMVP